MTSWIGKRENATMTTAVGKEWEATAVKCRSPFPLPSCARFACHFVSPPCSGSPSCSARARSAAPVYSVVPPNGTQRDPYFAGQCDRDSGNPTIPALRTCKSHSLARSSPWAKRGLTSNRCTMGACRCRFPETEGQKKMLARAIEAALGSAGQHRPQRARGRSSARVPFSNS